MPVRENTGAGRRFLISIGVTIAIPIVEIIGGYWVEHTSIQFELVGCGQGGVVCDNGDC